MVFGSSFAGGCLFWLVWDWRGRNAGCWRRAARGHDERQRQHPFVHEGPRRATKDHEERQLQHPFVHEGPRRTATATPFCPRRAAKNGNGNTLLSTKGREGPLRATKNGNCNTLFSTKGREGPRRTTKNGNCNTSFLRRAAKKTFNPLIHVGIQRAAENASLFYWGVAIYVGTGTAVWDVRGAEGDLTRPIFAAMMERGGCGIAPAGSRLDSVDGLPDEDE